MTTLADLILRTRKHLGAPEVLNQIGAVDADDTTVTFQRALSQVSDGTILSAGLETMYVWTADRAGMTAEVRRGHDGSTAQAHVSGTLVRVGPQHTDFDILSALNDELRSLSGAGLYAVRTLELTTSNDSARTYDLAADVQDVLDVRYDADTSANQWPRVSSWELLANMPVGEFASGKALRLDTAVPADRPLRVFYRAALGQLEALDDDVEEDTGLPASAIDIPPLGAAWRLVAPTEVERNQTERQGSSRRQDEVPPGAKMRSPLGLQQIRRERIREELVNLSRRWPSRGH